jgi:lipoprotein Spr
MSIKTFLSSLLLLCSVVAATGVKGSCPDPVRESDETEEFADKEQEQLAWCFIYSNRLGYDIGHVSEPTLFETVSRWLGTPYKYAGDSKKGIDCSGFASVVYRNVYSLQLDGGSSDIYLRAVPVSKDSLQEGDLVFFKIRPSRISHVGVYLGDNKFAHASVHAGVIISDLDEPYYRQRFYKGGRFNTANR